LQDAKGSLENEILEKQTTDCDSTKEFDHLSQVFDKSDCDFQDDFILEKESPAQKDLSF